MSDLITLLILAALLAGWRISLHIWPFARCRWCGGTGHNPGSTRRRFGFCKHCQGSGMRRRFGTRLFHTDDK